MSDLTGQIIGNYRIEALIGSGGMGQVFQGQHIHIDRPAAIKVLHASIALDPGFQARFRQEAKSIAALKHPNIVEIHDFGEQDGRYYLVLELLTDGSLRTLLQRYAQAQKPWPLTQGLELIAQASDALAYAHVQGMIHRDIKPDNMLLRPAGVSAHGDMGYALKLSDFGLAKLVGGDATTVTGTPVGTPTYMSPEQCQGQRLDGRSDIYALGVVLYELTTGMLPFSIRTLNEGMYKHIYTPPPSPRQTRPDFPTEVESIILRCLAKKPEQRYASANDLSIALQRALSNPALALYPTTTISPPQFSPVELQPTILPPISSLPPGARAPSQPSAAPSPDSLLNALLENPVGANLPSGSGSGAAANQQAVAVGRSRLAQAKSNVIGVAVERDTLELLPGQPASVRVTLANTGALVDHLDLSVEGVPKAWVRGPSAAVQLNPGAQTTVVLNVLVLRIAENRAAKYPVKILAHSRNVPTEFGSAGALWTVLPFTESTLTITPNRASGRGGATYALTLRNNGNVPASYRMYGSDDEQALLFRFEADRLQLDPGQSATRDLRVRARRRLIGSAQPHAITVEAEATDHAAPLVSAQFNHRALIPVWVPPVALALALLLCLGIYGWLAQGPVFEEAPTFKPDRPQPGQAVILSWHVAHAQTVDLRPEGQPAIPGLDPATGVYTFTQGFTGPTVIEIIARNRFFISKSENVSIGMIVPTATPTTEPGAPQVSFSVAPAEITLGETVTLNWSVSDAQSIEIEQLGTVASVGQGQNKPQNTTSYRLVATSKSGKQTARVIQVIVRNPTPQPSVTPVQTNLVGDAPSPTSKPVDVPTTPTTAVPPPIVVTDIPTSIPPTIPATIPTTIPIITKTIAFATRPTGNITGNEVEFAPLLLCVYTPSTSAYPAPTTLDGCPTPETGLQSQQPMIEADHGLTSGISNSVTLIAFSVPITRSTEITVTFKEPQASYQFQAFDAQNHLIDTIALSNKSYHYDLQPETPVAYLKMKREDNAQFWIARIDLSMREP